jgi:hypothetical protein
MIPNQEIGFVLPKSPLGNGAGTTRRRVIEPDHRSARSCCKSAKISRSFIPGFRAGNSLPADNGGLIHPWRSASRRNRSETSGLRPGAGGPSSATTRSQSVISTVSPPAASRMYSLSLFLSSLMPTDLMRQKNLPVAALSIIAMRQVALQRTANKETITGGERLIYIDFLTQNWVRSADSVFVRLRAAKLSVCAFASQPQPQRRPAKFRGSFGCRRRADRRTEPAANPA